MKHIAIKFAFWYNCYCLVGNLRPTLCDPMDCSLPGSSVHEISQARILEWFLEKPFPSPGDIPDPGIEPAFPALPGGFLTTESSRKLNIKFSSVESLSHVQLFVTPWTAAVQASLSITNSQSLLKLMSIELVMTSNHLILCQLLLWHSIFPSIKVFSNGSVLCIKWPKYWSFSFSISPFNEYSGLISYRMEWLDLLAVQGTLKSLLQHHSSKASILWHSAFFMVQLSHPYMTAGKTLGLARWTFVGKGMSLVFNMLSRLVITFLPRSECLLISWLQSSSAVILEPPKIKSATVSIFPPKYLPWSNGTRCLDLSFLTVEF